MRTSRAGVPLEVREFRGSSAAQSLLDYLRKKYPAVVLTFVALVAALALEGCQMTPPESPATDPYMVAVAQQYPSRAPEQLTLQDSAPSWGYATRVSPRLAVTADHILPDTTDRTVVGEDLAVVVVDEGAWVPIAAVGDGPVTIVHPQLGVRTGRVTSSMVGTHVTDAVTGPGWSGSAVFQRGHLVGVATRACVGGTECTEFVGVARLLEVFSMI